MVSRWEDVGTERWPGCGPPRLTSERRVRGERGPNGRPWTPALTRASPSNLPKTVLPVRWKERTGQITGNHRGRGDVRGNRERSRGVASCTKRPTRPLAASGVSWGRAFSAGNVCLFNDVSTVCRINI